MYDKVRVKTGKYKNCVGTITGFFYNGDRYIYNVANQYIDPVYCIGTYYSFDIVPITNDEYIKNLIKH